MTTPSDLTLTHHEAAHAHEPWVLVRFCGYQQGFGSMPGRALWNVVAGPYTVGSTVTIETMLAAGYRVEVIS
jgi:hypothetical protein